MRPILYAMIPVGFALMVGGMILMGQPTGGPVEDPDVLLETSAFDTSESPEADTAEVIDPDTDSAGRPTPSGPEYADNATVLD